MKEFRNSPAFKTAVVFITGILISKYIYAGTYFYFLSAIIFSLLIFYFHKKSIVKYKIAAVYILVLISGALKFSFDYKSDEKIPQFSDYIYIQGIITDIPSENNGRIKFPLLTEFAINENDTVKFDKKIIVQIINNKKTENEETKALPEAGDRILIFGNLRENPKALNEGEFDYSEYLNLHDINGIFYAEFQDDITVLSKENRGFITQKIILPARLYSINTIEKFTGAESGAYLNSLVTGYRAKLSEETKESFKRTGVMHLIAVSGLNVAYVILIITLSLSLIRVPRIPRYIITIIFLGFYVLFTGNQPSIIRAALMGSLFIIGMLINRKTDFYNILGFSALVILLFDSRQLFDPGFILSYTATFSMVFVYKRLDENLLSKINVKQSRFYKYLKNLLIYVTAAASAQIGVLPVTAMYFNQISIIGIIVNIIVVPIANISLAAGFMLLLLSIISSFLTGIAAEGINLILNIQLDLISWASNLNFASIEFFRFDIFNLSVYYAVLFLLLSNKKLIFKATVFLIFAVFILLYNSNTDRDFKVNFLYSGESNCTHLTCPDGSNVLIGAGEETPFKKNTSIQIIPYLKRKNIKEIDLILITDLTPAKAGGLRNIIKELEVKKIIYTSNSQNELNNFSDNKNIITETVTGGDIIKLPGNGLIFILNNDSTNNEDKRYPILLKFGNNKILFTEGISGNEADYISGLYGNFLESDILKTGRKKEMSATLLHTSKPKEIIIPTGRYKNKYENLEFKNALEKIISSKIHYTGIEGGKAYSFNGDKFEAID